MNWTELSAKLIDKVLEQYPIVKVTDTNYVLDDGRKIAKFKLRNEIFDYNKLSIIEPEFAKNIIDKSEENKRQIKSRFWRTLESTVWQAKQDSMEQLSKSLVKDLDIVDKRFDFEEFVMFRDISKGKYEDTTIVYDTKEQCITNINPDIYMDSLEPSLRSSFKPLDAVFEYDPFNIEPISPILFNRQEVNRVNTYKAPKWRKEKPLNTGKIPKIFGKFYQHLFPNLEARRYTISWQKKMILGRAEVYLCLNGAKGTGKNLFVDISKMLVGSENFGKASLSLLRNQFNAILEDKRLLFYDELKVGKTEHTRLKEIINIEQNIEKKGKDANNVTETHSNHIIANNDISDNYLEHDDRRFSYPPITSIPLKKAWSQEDIDELIDAINSPNLIQELGEFILAYTHDVYDRPFAIFKDNHFHNVVYSSLYGWKQMLVDKLVEESFEKEAISSIRMDAQDLGVRFPSTRAKIDTFLRDYLHYGEDRLGKLIKEGREVYLVKHNEEDEI